MKVPKYIQQNMHRVADLHRKAGELSRIIDEWFLQNGFDMDTLRCGDGFSLEELDYGNDVTDTLCQRIEKEGFGYGEET